MNDLLNQDQVHSNFATHDVFNYQGKHFLYFKLPAVLFWCSWVVESWWKQTW